MAIDRDNTLRKAEKLLRQGRLDAAIAEYAKVVDDQPRDWTTANLLGDLYVRAGQIERAVAQYTRIADNLAREGFLTKATALYKKIVKIHPDDDMALLRAAELAAEQGLGADARAHLQALFRQRLRRGDRPGAAKIAGRLAAIDPKDAVGRLESARMLAEMGELAAAADQLRAAGQALCGAGKMAEGIRAWREGLRLNPSDDAIRSEMVKALLDLGDPDAAREVARRAADLRAVAESLTSAGRHTEAISAIEMALAAEPDNAEVRLYVANAAIGRRAYAHAHDILAPVAADHSPGIQLALAEIELRLEHPDRAAAAIDQCLAAGPELASRLEDLGCNLARDVPEAGFAVIGAVVTQAETRGEADSAIAALERFLAVAPGHIQALERLARLSDEGFFEERRYRVRVLLADAYLAQERWGDARTLTEQLLTLRPDEAAHLDRLTRALAGLGVPDAEAVAKAQWRAATAADEVAEFVAGLPPRPENAIEPEAFELPPDPRGPVAAEPLIFDLPEGIARADRAGAAGAIDIDLPLRDGREPPRRHEALPGFGKEPDVYEIDLSGDLEDLLAEAAAEPSAPAPARTPAAGEDAVDLAGFFRQMRDSSGRDVDQAAAARAYDLASEHYNRGDTEAAVACLGDAVRDVGFRFRAASMLARIARERQQLKVAVEWLERAAESPAPTQQAAHAVLYELADTLESAGEQARALAVFLELQAAAPGYRDVAGRVRRLGPGKAGGPARGRKGRA